MQHLNSGCRSYIGNNCTNSSGSKAKERAAADNVAGEAEAAAAEIDQRKQSQWAQRLRISSRYRSDSRNGNRSRNSRGNSTGSSGLGRGNGSSSIRSNSLERLSNSCLLPSATSIAKLIAVKSSKQDEPRAHTHPHTALSPDQTSLQSHANANVSPTHTHTLTFSE